MKTKLYYVVQVNVTNFDEEKLCTYVSGPFADWSDANEDRRHRDCSWNLDVVETAVEEE